MMRGIQWDHVAGGVFVSVVVSVIVGIICTLID